MASVPGRQWSSCPGPSEQQGGACMGRALHKPAFRVRGAHRSRMRVLLHARGVTCE
jgi:hypothetical protein